jgi:hypothetical protein
MAGKNVAIDPALKVEPMLKSAVDGDGAVRCDDASPPPAALRMAVALDRLEHALSACEVRLQRSQFVEASVVAALTELDLLIADGETLVAGQNGSGGTQLASNWCDQTASPGLPASTGDPHAGASRRAAYA